MDLPRATELPRETMAALQKDKTPFVEEDHSEDPTETQQEEEEILKYIKIA